MRAAALTGAGGEGYPGEVRTRSQVRVPSGAARSAGGARRTAAPRASRTLASVLALVAVLLVGLLDVLPRASAQGAGQPLSVVASLHPWADLVRQVGGEHVDVTTLLPAGASPHAFEPLPSQAALLGGADLVVLNGGLDVWLERLVAATAPRVRRFVVMERVPFEPVQGHEEDGHDGEGANPHVWLDPEVAAAAVAALAEELAALRPALAEEFRANADAVRADIAAVAAEVEALLAPVRERPFVPYHDAWPYFARRFGLEVAATLEPFPGREPSARYVAETVAAIRRAGARVIFDERQLSGRTAQVVAESAGVAVVMLDPIGGAPGPATYQELLRHNARLIAEALGRE